MPKNNRQYNAERKYMDDIAKKDFDRDLAIESMYTESYNRMQQTIDGYYMRYANTTGMSLSDAKKLASQMDIKKFEKAAEMAVKSKDLSDETSKWLKTYNLNMRVNRVELLKLELELELRQLHDKGFNLMDKARYDDLHAEYKRQAGILGNSVTNPSERLNAVLDADFYGKGFSERVWGRNGIFESHLSEVFKSLSRINTDLDGYKKERNRLAEQFDITKYQSQRLLSTESSRIRTDTGRIMLEENEFTHYVYVTEPGACKLCSPLDGKLIELRKMEIGVNVAPLHPSCRCSFYGVIEMKRKDGSSNLDEYKN